MSTVVSTDLTGVEKASILLMALGTSLSAQALKFLTEDEIERLAPEMVRLRNIDPQLSDAVLTEFEETRTLLGSGPSGGREFTAQVLEQALGQEKARQMMEQSAGVSTSSSRPFQCLCDADAAQIARILSNEQPQLIALVLTNIPPDNAASVISLLDPEIQVEVAMRVASSEDTGSEVLTAIEDVIKASLASTPREGAKAVAGPEALVEILSRAERSTERLVLDALNSREPEMGAEVRRKMFLFEDIVKLPDRSVQSVLREIDQEQLRIALKGADERVQEVIFRNMSERAVESLKEDLELLQNVRTKEIEAAQQKIGFIVRRMLSSGEITMAEEDGTAQEGS